MAKVLSFLYLTLDNVIYLGILTLVFMTVAALILSGVLFIQRRESLLKRLSRFLPGKPPPADATKTPELLEKESNGFFVRLTRPLHAFVAPPQHGLRRHIRLQLSRAGLRSELAFGNFIAAKIILAISLPMTFLAFRFFYKMTPEVILGVAFLVVLGFFLPNLIVHGLAVTRQEAISWALPDALDLMVVCIESGYGLDMTFKRVGEEMRKLAPELSDEFSLTNREIRAGRPREESFKEMSLRTGVPEIHNLMTMLVQTSRFGTSLAKALRIHSEAMRIKRRQIAEEKAAKSAVKLVFPLILFVFPGLLIVLAGPAFIRIYQALLPALTP